MTQLDDGVILRVTTTSGEIELMAVERYTMETVRSELREFPWCVSVEEVPEEEGDTESKVVFE